MTRCRLDGAGSPDLKRQGLLATLSAIYRGDLDDERGSLTATLLHAQAARICLVHAGPYVSELHFEVARRRTGGRRHVGDDDLPFRLPISVAEEIRRMGVRVVVDGCSMLREHAFVAAGFTVVAMVAPE